jgi:hypothetical protein
VLPRILRERWERWATIQAVDAPGEGLEWDARKAQENERKHGVSFAEARTAFRDPDILLLPDELHSWDEYREIAIAVSSLERLLAIVFTRRENRIRIIGARFAERHEEQMYDE